MRVLVAGGGPAGLAAASRLRGVDAIIVEAMPRLGVPAHCTGIVSPWTARRLAGASIRRLEAEGLVEAYYREALFLDGRLRERCSVSARPLAVKLARPGLEDYLAGLAAARGHRVATRSRLVAAQPLPGGVEALVETPGGVARIRASRLLVATGAQRRSGAAPQTGCLRATGLEARLLLSRRIPDEVFVTIHGTPLAPGFFAWLAPVRGGREAVVGLASSRPARLHRRLEALLALLARRGLAEPSRVLGARGGHILRGPPAPRAVHGRVGGLGDVLCASKPYTGGGLYAIAALAAAAARWLEEGRGLEEEWRRLRRELVVQHLLTRLAAAEPGLFLRLLSAACGRAAEGSCRVDFDRHSSLAACLVPLRGLVPVRVQEKVLLDRLRGAESDGADGA